MICHFAMPRPAAAAAVALIALIAAPRPAPAWTRQAHHDARPRSTGEAEAPRPAGTPLMAIVSLKSQTVTVYDTDGWILRAPVSTGMKGRETPSGVFSVIQKQRDHYSNIYDDAYMPNMQRITWSGIAMHGGVLPGRAASHGCIRMPYGFAERLFPLTSLGLRVIVAPDDAAPVEIADPKLPQPKPDDSGAKAAALAAAADTAVKQADAAHSAAAAADRDAARAAAEWRKVDAMMKRAEGDAAVAERMLARAGSDAAKARADDAKQKANARIAELQPQWDAAKAAQDHKADAVASARDAAAAADTARQAAVSAAREAAREREPVSIFVSRKAQKLYVRRGFTPLFDAPVTIRDPDQPIGTHVFTAIGKTGTGLRWSVVTITDGHARFAEAQTTPGNSRDTAPVTADTSAAKEALDRITIPPDVLDRIGPGIAPRTSLIISDEALSPETGKGTEFVAVLSNEPQGGLAMRHHPSSGYRYGGDVRYGYPRVYWRQPYNNDGRFFGNDGGFFRW